MRDILMRKPVVFVQADFKFHAFGFFSRNTTYEKIKTKTKSTV